MNDYVKKLIIQGEDGEELSLQEILPGPIDVEREVFVMQLQEQVRKEIDKLRPRECLVIKMRLGLDDGKPKTLDAIGKEFNLTRERVRQIEKKAMCKLSKNPILKELWNDRP